MRYTVAVCLALCAAALLFVNRGLAEEQAPEPAPKVAERPEKLILTSQPDDSAEHLHRHFGTIAAAIEKATGIPTEYVLTDDYAASVLTFVTGRAHLAWLDALSIARAQIQMSESDQVMAVLACRDTDKRLKSYFIANIDTGLSKFDDLEDLIKAVDGKNWKFTYGSRWSITSYYMPRHFLTEKAGKDIHELFDTIAYSASHDMVLQMVAEGEFHIGAMDAGAYDRAPDETKERAPIVYTTPEFNGHGLAARGDLAKELIDQIRDALLKFHESEQNKSALEYLRAEKFVTAELKEWEPYRKLLEEDVDE